MVLGFRSLGFRGLRCRVGFRVWALVFKADRSEKKTEVPEPALGRPHPLWMQEILQHLTYPIPSALNP